MVAKYRFYQVLRATLQPSTALDENTIGQAGINGLGIEMALARLIGFEPEPDIRVPENYEEVYATQALSALRHLQAIDMVPNQYQVPLPWFMGDSFEAIAGGHPDFIKNEGYIRHYIDLKTTDLPTEEHALKLLRSPQMCAYLAADQQLYPNGLDGLHLSVLLQSQYTEKPEVKYNKDGATVSLTGQTGTHEDLLVAVEAMGDAADERHWAMAFKAPRWSPSIFVTLTDREEIRALANIGRILLDAGIEILESGAHHLVTRPYI